ncbi:type 1 glutamine amidotransferase domain-containing protein [Thiohalomonas denitrificans]|uniref:Protease I n=1 Tax=Thiohalomonas denitrificans TaxID=415747 RepID=A0A1G5R2Y6_9GAMM|nr:type 1 glutamine amidotransferase domain-containing protein [Thiohalomonas denitrificans]SCZ68367.1 protease I [Thiohalomonas denitrificans]
MRAIMISADGFEDAELLKPLEALRADDIEVELATPGGASITGKRGATVEADSAIEQVDPSAFDLLVLPGGKAPAQLRKDPKVLAIAREFFSADKPIAAICHGPQILVSADLLRGRKATAYSAVAPELREAGAEYRDEEVVVDGNLITSREPGDIPAFIGAVREKLGIQP